LDATFESNVALHANQTQRQYERKARVTIDESGREMLVALSKVRPTDCDPKEMNIAYIKPISLQENVTLVDPWNKFTILCGEHARELISPQVCIL